VYRKIVHVKFRWGGQGHLQRRLVSQQITVKVKTLHGLRKIHSLTVSIFDKVSTILDQVAKADPECLVEYRSPRFVYP